MVTTKAEDLIEAEVVVGAPPAVVFAYLTDPERIGRWMGEAAPFLAVPGSAFRINVAGRHLAAGQIVAVEADRRLVLTWGWDEPGHPIPPGSSTVEITLLPTVEGTLVRLVHRDLPESAIAQHRHGWDHYLDRLATIAAGGDPGFDTLAAAPEV